MDDDAIREDAYARLSDGLSRVQDAQATLIVLELAHGLPRLTDNARECAGRLELADAALREPGESLSLARAEAAQAQARIQACAAELKSRDLDTRVRARLVRAEYARELDGLNGNVAQAVAVLRDAEAERDKAREDYHIAEAMVEVRKDAIKNPFTHPIAQNTETYSTFRAGLGSLTPVLLANNDEHPEWAPAMILHKHLDTITGTVPLPTEPEPEPSGGNVFDSGVGSNGRDVMDADIASLKLAAQEDRDNVPGTDPRVRAGSAPGMPSEGPNQPSDFRPIDRPEVKLPKLPKKYRKVPR